MVVRRCGGRSCSYVYLHLLTAWSLTMTLLVSLNDATNHHHQNYDNNDCAKQQQRLSNAKAKDAAAVGDNRKAHVHAPPIFVDDERYKIKSCLSPDLELHDLDTCRFYAMMIDAGSTGTRIHIFEFSHQPNHSGSPFKLESETFDEVKPGLSSFAGDAKGAADSVRKLLDTARTTVPSAMWQQTPLALKATAGLRLLPENEAEEILEQIEILFTESPFLVAEDAVAVMSGVDEGIFGWFTLNFLLDRIDSVLMDPEHLLKSVSENWTAGALDLGGGSTQVTFRPLQSATISSAPSGFVKPIGVFNQEVQLYTHSYLGNGLIAARLSILQGSTKPTPTATTNHELYTACMPPDVTIKWNYSAADWTVRGTKRYSYDACANEVVRFVRSCNIDVQAELATRDLYAFSYFYDRAMQTRLVPPNTGGPAAVAQFKRAAQKSCARRKSDFGKEHWQPWQCLDLTYIHSLFAEGYKLPEDKQINLAKKLRGNMETSWALGAAYHLLNTYHERSVAKRMQRSTSVGNATSSYASVVLHYVTHVLKFLQLVS